MTTIYVIRHAEAEGNLYRIAQGQYNSGVTDRGWRQIAALEERFRDIHIDAVYASDLYRTCATASAIYRPRGLTLHREPALREINMGSWEQKTWGQIARDEPEQLENFMRHLHLWRAPGAETLTQLRDRMTAALRRIVAENPGKTVAVFSHGCAIRVLLSALQGLPPERLSDIPVGDNTSVSRLEAEGEEIRVAAWNDNSHLKTPAYLATETNTHRTNGAEPGLYFEPLSLPEQGDFFRGSVQSAWNETGEDRPWDDAALMADAGRPTLVGYLQGQPVGLIQLHPEKEADSGHGWVSLYCIDRPWRNRGYGAQLLGQAVNYYRPLGRQALRVALAADGAAGRFFRDYGFAPAGRTPTGRTIWEKSIALDPEFLSAPQGD